MPADPLLVMPFTQSPAAGSRARPALITTCAAPTAAVVLATIWVGCASRPDLPPQDNTPVTIEQFDSATIDTFCRLFVQCNVIEDFATCKAQDFDLNADADLVAAVLAGKIIFHGDKARECLNGYAPAGCDTTQLVLVRPLPLACYAAFEGTVGAAGACALDEECISQRCDRSMCTGDDCCVGKCFAGPAPGLANAGESCERSHCVDSYCDFTSFTCRAYLGAGERCGLTEQCQPGLACHATCQTEPRLGEPCQFGRCRDLGTTCSLATSTCVAVGLAGDRCQGDDDCSPFYRCDSDGRCTLKPQRGEACTSSCGDHSFCDENTGTCTDPQPDGAPCMTTSQCDSHYCDFDTRTCTVRPVCI